MKKPPSSALLVPLCLGFILPVLATAADADAEPPFSDGSTEALNARADYFRLDNDYTPPPGEARHHYTAGFAKILCSAVFITGLDPDDAAANVGGFISPFEQREYVTDIRIDRDRQQVALTLPDGVIRTARRYGSQGCVARPMSQETLQFTPSIIEPNLPPADTTAWPMGDVLPDDPWPQGVDRELVERALDVGFGPEEARTLGLVITYKGRIIAERYGDDVDMHTPLESWSMTKSLTGTLLGVLINQGAYELWQPAPIPEWYIEQDDPRQQIRIGDIMRMSSGIMINAPADPDFDDSTYPDHVYLYTGGENLHQYAATRPQEYPPNTIGRYRNTDPVIASYLIRLAVEGRGDNYHEFPQRALFDKLGIRSALIETDAWGNFLGQGLGFMSARDWARLGNLYLQDGVADHGERLLPEGFVDYASTVAPAWQSDGRPIYGGAFLWLSEIERENSEPLKAMHMRGAGGQSTNIIPSHDLVYVRIGKYSGARAGGEALTEMLPMLLDAVPAK